MPREKGIPWDKEAVYDAEISPLMSRIIAICKEHEIPCVASFQYVDDVERGPGHCTTALVNEARGDSLFIRKVATAARPEKPFVLAETIVTNPDGSKNITMRRVT
jgi:hypothetical protein